LAEKKCVEFWRRPDTLIGGMNQISLDKYLVQLRTARETAPTKFLRRLLDYAIIKTERMIADDGRRPSGSLPRIPDANAQIIEAAIGAREIEKILGILDSRGSHGASDERLVELIKECYAKSGDVSTRQIKHEGKRRGLRADRGRIEKLREQLNLGRDQVTQRAKRVEALQYIDLTFVHLQANVIVLGFAAQGCDEWVERIVKLQEDSAPAPLIAPTSADRARLTDFVRQLVETRAALEGDEPNWELLFKDLEDAEEKIVFFHAFAETDVPAGVSMRLRQLAPVVHFDRDWLLKELMRPEMFYLGAGYLPTMADTLQRLAVAKGGTSETICIRQSAASRTDALWLRSRLQETLSEQGIRVRLGVRQAFRLGRRSSLKVEGSSEENPGTALLVPCPIALRLFRLDEPDDAEKIQLDFAGADHLLARTSMDDLVRRFRQALNLQSAFASTRGSEPMVKCAEFFCAADTPIFGITSVMGRRPDFRKMTNAHRALWAAYVLTLFDPDVLQPESHVGDSRAVLFCRAIEDFRSGAAQWIESWRETTLRFHKKDHCVRYAAEEAIEATVVAMEQMLSRVWKFGMDEAAKRFAAAIERASKEKFHGTDWRKDPQEAITQLGGYFEGVWPTVWVSRKAIQWRARRLLKSTSSDIVARRKKSVRSVSEKGTQDAYGEENGDGPDVVISSDLNNSWVDAQSETPEMLIRERLEHPITAGDDRRLAAWYTRLLAAARLASEYHSNRPLLLPGVLPRPTAMLLRNAVQKSLEGGNLAGVGKRLSEALEKFFRDQ